jgi:hypothetical protein
VVHLDLLAPIQRKVGLRRDDVAAGGGGFDLMLALSRDQIKCRGRPILGSYR